jgi:CubicO group peptidase (beta-lactamase class C family)
MSPDPIDVLLSEIDAEAAQYLAEVSEGTLMVGITVNGERHVRRYRSEGAELAVLPAEDSIYEIGSVSKVYAATVLASLVNEGRLSLDDTVSSHLPNGTSLPSEIAGITVRDLVTHTAGLPSIGRIHQSYIDEETRGQTLPPLGYTTHYLRYRKEHLYKDWETLALDYPTGTKWNYSVISMGTVGHILELVAGQPYEELLIERVCKPLGLVDTAYELAEDQQLRMVRAFLPNGSPAPNWYHDVLMSQGGLRSTMQDLLTFAEANIAAGRGEDTSPLGQAMQLARTPVRTAPRFVDPLGKGDVIQQLAWRGLAKRPQASEHGGVTLFYQSGLAVDDETRTGVVMLTSSHDNMGDVIASLVDPDYTSIGARFLDWFDRACSLGDRPSG